jgi:hypothetical protein
MQQWIALRKAFPELEGGVRQNRMCAAVQLQPTSLSAVYRVRLKYSLEKNPKAFVEEPPLQERDGNRPPHLYADDSLCLYLPQTQEWAPSMFVADTIVPWASEWLFHYEIWLSTGEWQGGGIHPGDRVSSDSCSRSRTFRSRRNRSTFPR